MLSYSVNRLYLGHPEDNMPPAHPQRFGVEVEVEGVNLPVRIMGWRTTHDGSLRGPESLEYVFSQPTNRLSGERYIDSLASRFDKEGVEIIDSCRAGVHIHMDMLHRTLQEVMTFLMVYYVVEDTLIQMCGVGRQGNLFCLRSKDAEYIIDQVISCLEQKNSMALLGDQIRYAAMNTNALGRHGTLEFRALRTPTDLREIKWWLGMFEEMLDNTFQQFNTPIDVVSLFSADGPDQLLNLIFPSHAKKIRESVPDYHVRMMQGIRLAQDMAYCNINWEN